MLFDDTLRDLLSRASTIAILGAKDKPGSPVDRVGRYLMAAGYRVFPVHPVRKTVWGMPAAARLSDLPGLGFEPDIVCLFRAADYCPDHARETLALPRPPLLFWMQEGIRSPEAGEMLSRAGIAVVEDRCLQTEHKRLFPPKLFSCRRCGHCCHGRGGIVLGPRDLPRLAAHLGLTPEECLTRHTEILGGKPMLLCGDDGYCRFYRADRGCAVHEARPDVCRAWPYFRGNLVDPVSFDMAKADCPGIARDAAHADFAWEGFAYLKTRGILGTDPVREGRALIVGESELPARPRRTDAAPAKGVGSGRS
ncbi:MAG TPA: CoA-binding protein [Candidatus Mailhella merdigallinarum]|uniref:CoA-binding protein n=1 Tax=Candidatus Mailhella merdigallinarum TaxID=2838658 RepID=A0A9D2HE57_9BACT|nr:MAG: hypothetical protein DBX67_04460 [Desulfovibrionaceae bacterium]HJA08531.1 CoA-binding protein [Candidatus Mailhella merdigallinarum]